MDPRWDSDALTVASDTARLRRYRRAQSRWRETVLGLPPGESAPARNVGSRLRTDAPDSAQWLTPHVAAYVADRLPQAERDGEAIERGRLFGNLLSSQPLCFNVFGQLAAYPNAAARLLTRLLDQHVDRVDDVLVEHTPPAAKATLGDRSAFDAYLALTIDGAPAFVGVETKYTEPFSATKYRRDSYDQVTERADGWFVKDAARAAVTSATNQLWRTLMLAQTTELQTDAGSGTVLVLCLDDDPHATQAVDGMHELLREPDRRLRRVTFERMVEAASEEEDLRAWAALFTARYLTL
ncbi:PGN_0703 family putative restriction endonuclease [Aquipuribacter sp. SD81]|uniref:PGN_0703 family putative restriction endonuclease n=1 Tax=Aquipuribacter sp. SD81 TaxID=3127703 RepID=UPI0030186226